MSSVVPALFSCTFKAAAKSLESSFGLPKPLVALEPPVTGNPTHADPFHLATMSAATSPPASVNSPAIWMSPL